jgi:tetratricopeptide (TPR) repeat protein
MRTALLLGLLATSALALDLMETKDGKLIPVLEAKRVGDRLHVRLAAGEDQRMATAYPIDRILPEFVFYVWQKGLPEHDRPAHMELAEWARKNGLFSLSLKVYEAMAEFDEGIKGELPSLRKALSDEEATWLFERAEALFREGEVADARIEVDRLLELYPDSAEQGRAKELRKMIDERNQQLTAERRKKEEERRLRRQRIEVRTQAARIAQGRAYAGGANLRQVAVARWRLNWACCLYEGAIFSLEDLLPYVENDALRAEIVRHMDEALSRSVAAYVRLADLRYLNGDFGAALDAVHHVLDMDPDNAAATGIRDRILDGPGPQHIRYDRGFMTFKRSNRTIGGGWFGGRRFR